MFTEKLFMQKLNYIHNNPLQAKWQLYTTPENYFYSSAKFYETGLDDFGVLTHFRFNRCWSGDQQRKRNSRCSI